jgi:hypothetical protein
MQVGSRVFKAPSCVIEAAADVKAATVYPHNAVSALLITTKHCYSGDTTQQDASRDGPDSVQQSDKTG